MVDDISVNETIVQQALIGDDEPGSSVKLGIRRKNGGTSVILTRMDSAAVADKRWLFELFTKIKDNAAKRDSFTLSAISECIQVWTCMLMHDYEHGASLQCDIEAMQSVCKVTLQQQASILKELWKKLTRDPLPPSILPRTTLAVQTRDLKHALQKANEEDSSMKKTLTFPPSLRSTSSPITHPLNTNATQHRRPRHESVKDAKRKLLSAASSRAAEHDNTFLLNAKIRREHRNSSLRM
jgi:hypothetical protein